MAGTKKQEKMTIAEYRQAKEQRAKRWFRMEMYPWPVTLALAVPLVALVFLLIYYALMFKNYNG